MNFSPIRQAALDLYKPPFVYRGGNVYDSANEMVLDRDSDGVMRGLLAARIRGWGRIQFMDKPELRAAALQDEVGHIVAEALNAFWQASQPNQDGVK